MEKEKKEWSAVVALAEKVKKFENGKQIAEMDVQEWNVLMKWFHEPNLTQGRVDKKGIFWKY